MHRVVGGVGVQRDALCRSVDRISGRLLLRQISRASRGESDASDAIEKMDQKSQSSNCVLNLEGLKSHKLSG
jgi:hypothetical protein